MKPLVEKHKFIYDNKLCFGCLKKGHRSKDCRRKGTCAKCKGRHPTSLHEERNKQNKSSEELIEKNKSESENQEEVKSAISCKVNMHNTINSSMIVPVWVSTINEPDQEVLVYALLDTQSDSTIMLDDLRNSLKIKTEPTRLKLSTMASRETIIHCDRVSGLQVRGFASSVRIPLPPTYTREYIPVDKSHIPTREAAKQWPHLEVIVDELPPIQSCEVGLLIGYNCPQALLPREILSGDQNQPFAQRTDLGWSIVGCISARFDQGHSNGVSHRILVKEVPAVTPSDIIKILESDFADTKNEDKCVSQNDLQFIRILEEGIHQREDNHYEMPLPFRKAHPELPNNKKLALLRLGHLKKKLSNNPQYYSDYTSFMNEILRRGEAEKEISVNSS